MISSKERFACLVANKNFMSSFFMRRQEDMLESLDILTRLVSKRNNIHFTSSKDLISTISVQVLIRAKTS